MHYGLIFIAALLFSTQFLFNQRFQQETGNTWSAARTFTIYTSATGFVIFFALNGFRLEFSWFSLGVASALAAVNILCSFANKRVWQFVRYCKGVREWILKMYQKNIVLFLSGVGMKS